MIKKNSILESIIYFNFIIILLCFIISKNIIIAIIPVFISFIISILNINDEYRYIYVASIMILLSYLLIYKKNYIYIYIYIITIKEIFISLLKREKFTISKVNIFYILFIISIFMSIKNAISISNVISSLNMFLSLGCISYITVISLDDEEKIKYIIRVGISMCLVLNIIYITNNLEYILNGKILSTNRALIYLSGNTGIRSNTLAGILGIFVPMHITLIMINKGYKKVMYIILFMINAFIIITMSSRGVLIGLLTISIFIYLILNGKHKIKYIGYICIVYLLLNVINPHLIDNILSRFILNNQDLNELSSGRLDIYKYLIKLFFENPFFGIGMNNFCEYPINGYIVEDGHNFILTYLSSIGFFGTLFFILWLYFKLNKPIKLLIKNKFSNYTDKYYIMSILMSVIFMIIHGLFEPSITTFIPLIIFNIYISGLYSYSKIIGSEIYE